MSITSATKGTVGPRERYHVTPDKHLRRILTHIEQNKAPAALLALYMLLSTRPPGWKWNRTEDLGRRINCGRNVTRNLLGHLEQLGYYRLTRSRDRTGKWLVEGKFYPDGNAQAEPETRRSNLRPKSGSRSDQAKRGKVAGQTCDRNPVPGPTSTDGVSPQVKPATGSGAISITPYEVGGVIDRTLQDRADARPGGRSDRQKIAAREDQAVDAETAKLDRLRIAAQVKSEWYATVPPEVRRWVEDLRTHLHRGLDPGDLPNDGRPPLDQFLVTSFNASTIKRVGAWIQGAWTPAATAEHLLGNLNRSACRSVPAVLHKNLLAGPPKRSETPIPPRYVPPPAGDRVPMPRDFRQRMDAA